MKTRGILCLTALALLGLLACVPAKVGPASSTITWPGRQQDGSILLPNQWSLRPVGTQVELGDFPVNVAVHPEGRFAAVLQAGHSGHHIRIIDLDSRTEASRTSINETFYGLEFSHDGTQLFCSGAGDELVHRFTFSDAKLSQHRRIRLRDPKVRGVVAGLALNTATDRLWAANVWGHRITEVSLASEAAPLDIALDGQLASLQPAPVLPSADPESAAAEKRAEVALYPSNPKDTFPYACKLDETRQRLYVSLWAQAQVAVLDLPSRKLLARWTTEDHPCEMALTRSGKFLFVANANRNTVTIFDTDSGKPIETIWAALYPTSPPGSTPNSLALTPDEKTLFVANACNNVIAVFDISKPGKSRSLGFIPAGWYPTSVRVTPDGKKLLIANGKGLAPRANPLGPQPGIPTSARRTSEYIARLFKGSLSIIDLPSANKRNAVFADWTSLAYQCSPLRADFTNAISKPGNPIPSRIGDPSPIKYCLYIIKENRTYDQVLGDMPEGNGDPALCLFPESTTPNHHQLARDFVLLDNFYVESEVSADGHEWTVGAYASDFVEKMWPLGYGHNRSGKYPYVSEGSFPIATPAGGYLWDRAREAGVSFRSYGEFVRNGATPDQPAQAKLSTLKGHIDEWFRSFDLSYPDMKRADRFIAELKRFEAAGDMPRLQIIRLPNDHTHGASPGFPTPTAYLADNDLAFGRIVEAVTHSRFWPQTAIFVVEDDAQNGPDHVDAHRTLAYVISPYTRRNAVDSTLYSTSSMLRTMELILGLQPMSQFDAAAIPMFNSFQPTPDLRPYKALPVDLRLDEKNLKTAWGGHLEMNFASEDAADDLLLNEVIWRSVKGADQPMPAPVRAGFVFAKEDSEKDE